MPLPEKDYYSLEETALRWKISLKDLQYYAAHSNFEVLAWLDAGVVNIYRLKRTEDGDTVPVFSGLKPYRGYAVIPADNLRQIFRSDAAPLRRFIDPATREHLEMHESHPSHEVTSDDIVISRMERDRFEQFYALLCGDFTKPENYTRPVSFAGRPSSMHQVKQHFLERCREGKLLPSLQQEADYLSHWAEQNITECQPPKAKAIMNALRSSYREYRSTGI